jgi:hypothetical protein
MTNDTTNSLTDFDMCLAIAQKAINSQMKAAWETWLTRSEFSKTGEIKGFALVTIDDDDNSKTAGIEVKFAPLTVSLNVENGMRGQVQVTLHVESGSFFVQKNPDCSGEVNSMMLKDIREKKLELEKIADSKVFAEYKEKYRKENPDKFSRKEISIANWSISFVTDICKKFVTDIAKKNCNFNALEKIDPDVRGKVEEFIKENGMPDSVFSIEYLFMKFTQVNLLLDGNKNIQVPNDFEVPNGIKLSDIKNKFLTCLGKLLEGQNGDFMLGTVVRLSEENFKDTPPPTFALTDFIFDVKGNSAAPEASTLSYLGMFEKRPLPDNNAIYSLNLKDNWVRPEMLNGNQGLFAGVMAISKKVFMDKYLIPKIQNNLEGASLKYSELAWTFKYQPQAETKEEKGFSINTIVMDYKYEKAASYCLTLTVKPGTSIISISGKLESYAYYHGYEPDSGVGVNIPLVDLVVGSITGKKKLVSLVRIKAHQDISGSIDIRETNGDFMKLEYSLDDGVLDENSVQGYADESNKAEILLKMSGIKKGMTYQEDLMNQQKRLGITLTNTLSQQLSNLKVKLKNQAFIPPGGSVFTFQPPRFSQAGDLLFDVIYKAP